MARLPKVGSDAGSWGNVLNDFLSVEHNTDGTLKASGSLGTKYTKPDTGIPKTDLSADVQASLDSSVTGTVPDATTTTKGIVRLAGDLTGDALLPLIAPGKVTGGTGGSIATGTITDSNIHATAAIDKSKLAPLAITNQDIAVGAAIVQSKIQNLVSDLADKAPIIHAHDIVEVTGLQAALDSKAPTSHTHLISHVTGLQATLDSKAFTSHTHTASNISDLTAATANIIGARVQAGTNVIVDFDSGTGVTTISSTAAGGGGTPSTEVMSVAGRTGDVVLGAGDIVSGTFTTNRIPNLDTSKITSGTFGIAQIPTGSTGTTVALGDHTHSGYAATSHTHVATDIASGTLAIARIPTGTTSTTVALGNHTHASTYAALSHSHDDRYYTETEIDASLSNKLNTSEKGATNGVATLGSDGKIPASQLPAIAIKDTYTVASQSAMLALTAQRGDMAIRTDSGRAFVLASDSPTTLADWKEITSGGGGSAITSVNGQTGVVVLDAADVGAAASTHTHTASQISDSTTVGRSVLVAASAAAARTAIGAGTSNLALGTTSATALAGDYAPDWADVTGKPAVIAAGATATAARTAIGAGTGDVTTTALNAAIASMPIVCIWNSGTSAWQTLSGGAVPTSTALVRWYDSTPFATGSVTAPTHYSSYDKWYQQPAGV